MKLITGTRIVGTAGICASLALAGCGDGGGGTGQQSQGQVVDGGTFTMALTADPGNLDPQSSAATALFTVTQLGYDTLVSVDSKSGDIRPQLAEKWSAQGTDVTLTLRKGITCADGTPMTARVVSDNLGYVGDPENKSPFLGTFLPAGATATGDDAAGTVTLKLAAPAPFVLNGLASLPMVCPGGMADRTTLARGTSGTGPYTLTEAVPGDHYTYAIREGYDWGPDGATTATPGMPDTVVIRIVENPATAANLLLSGELNAAQVTGPDAERLEKAGLFAARTTAVLGEQWYNQAEGHATADPAVRMALTQALDLAELRTVLSAGKGTPPTTLAAIEPVACPGGQLGDALPAHDAAAATEALKKIAGRPLVFAYPTNVGSAGTAAAELAIQQWKAAGIEVTAKPQSADVMNQTLFGTGDWDIAWAPINVNSPDQLVPFLSGPTVPDGTNFAGIGNSEYDAAVKQASAVDGVAGCASWLAAETALVKAADVVPFANQQVPTFGVKARFETPGQLIPTSIRMLDR
ncbi:ABC transporter substrate-binding protein [Plantactinospora sp. WMMC1484]|uniref:ABC transporter substrate-binding protein n=1 Tax=Plantactinospora sp. WMMC1484 TaxID=3404122 RepID=UPI003BF5F271